MFVPLTERERQQFFSQNSSCFIPGYTGHCPTLRFQYGTSYGTKTKEILQELKDKHVLQTVKRTPYKQPDYGKTSFDPIVREKGQMSDPKANFKKPYKYIIGYTGFIPTMSFRYGKSYSRTADDSMHDFDAKQRRRREQKEELERLRTLSAPKLTSIRNKDDVDYILKQQEEKKKFKSREISPEFPPIAGYTGYIPKVKGNEESLSQRYNTVVKRSLTLLRQERDNYSKNTSSKIKEALKDFEPYEPTPFTK